MILLTPGPTFVPEYIREAMSKETIHHRTPEFEAIFQESRFYLQKVFRMEDNIILSSSGTGAMEASILNFCKKKALVINAGKFGDRFSQIVKSAKKELVELKYEWDTPANLEDVKEALVKNPDIDTLAIQVCESAGGLRHPAEQIAKLAKEINRDITVIADGITAVLVEPIDASNFDILIAGSQKAFMLPPGLAMMGVSKKAIEHLEATKGSGYYFNLYTELKKQQKNTTAWTAPTTLIIGLNALLKRVFTEYGIFATYLDSYQRAKATRDALVEIGLKIYPKSPAIAMSTIYSEHSNQIRSILKSKYSVNIAGGQEHLKGKIFRINHMGHIDTYQASWVLNAIELALDELKIRKFDSSANRVFLNSYLQNRN